MITEALFKNGGQQQDDQQVISGTKGATAMQPIGQFSRVTRIMIATIVGGVLTVGSLAISPMAEWWAGSSQDAPVAAGALQPNVREVSGGYREYMLLQQDALARSTFSKPPSGKTDDDQLYTQQLGSQSSHRATFANNRPRNVDPSVLDHSPRPLYGNDNARTVDPSVYRDQWNVTK